MIKRMIILSLIILIEMIIRTTIQIHVNNNQMTETIVVHQPADFKLKGVSQFISV